MLLLLVAALGLLWVVVAAHRDELGFPRLSLRGSFVLAFLAFELVLLAITEVSSIGDHFTAGVVEGAWAAVLVVLVWAARRPIGSVVRSATVAYRGRLGASDGDGSLADELGAVELGAVELVADDLGGGDPPVARQASTRRWTVLSGEEWVWVGLLAGIFGVLAAVGSLYLPANTDSMMYHLARVEHWIQNGTIAPFASHYLALVELSPLSEYNLAHLQLLSGTDRFDAWMQLTAAVVCIVGVSELVRLIGGSRWAQVTASVVCATIPSGVLLATSTENDYFAAATGVVLLVAAAAFSFERGWARRAIVVGCAAGVAYLAKGTMPVMVGPAALVLLVVAGYRRWGRDAFGDALEQVLGTVAAAVAAAVVAVAVVAGPFLVQNFELFRSPIGPVSKSTIISTYSPTGMAANVVHSVAANFDVGNGVAGVDTYLARLTLPPLHALFGAFGVSPHNPLFNFTSVGPSLNSFAVQNWTLFERLGDFGANPWDVTLMVVSLVGLIVAVVRGQGHGQGQGQGQVALALAFALTVGFVLFSAVARWSPFNVRYTLPVLVAWSAVIAYVLSRFRRSVGRVVLIGLVVACLPQLLDNANRPLVPTTAFEGPYLTAYFANHGTSIPPAQGAAIYQSVTTMVAQSSCRRVGLFDQVMYQFPLWVAFDHEHWHGRLFDWNVKNASRSLEPATPPCAQIGQVDPRYNTPDNGTVNAQLGNMTVSIDARDAGTIHTAVPRFASSASGVRVLPGGGWSLAAIGQDPLLGGRGSVYLFARTQERVQLRLVPAPTVPQPSLEVTGPSGAPAAVTRAKGQLEVDLRLRRGANRVGLVAGVSAQTSRRILVLTNVDVAPAGSSGP